MTRAFRRVLLAFTLAACTTKDASPGADSAAATTAAASTSAGSPEQDLADVQGYRLSMEKFDRFMAAQRNLALKMKDLSPAEREAMEAKGDADDGSDDSLDDMVRKIEGEPLMNSAIRDAGLSAREFALITMSMIQSGMAAGVLKMRPNDNADSLVREMKANMDNVRFMQQNEAEIQRKQKEFEAEMKRLGVPADN